MIKIKQIIGCLAIFATLLLSGCNQKNVITKTAVPNVTGEFNFSVLKAGQADAIIIKTQSHCVIIDCGEKDDGDEIAEYLSENNITNIDCLFITHFDKDHVGGFPKVIESVTASKIFVPDYEGSNDEYEKYLKSVEENGLNVNVLTEDTSFIFDDVLFEVSAPQKNSYSESDNDFSLVISVTHGENTFLFTGDAEAERLREILTVFGHQYDFLKVPHHGKYNKNTKLFISTIKPTYSVITDSDKNPADDRTLSILEGNESMVYSTKSGDISVTSDGKEIKIEQ